MLPRIRVQKHRMNELKDQERERPSVSNPLDEPVPSLVWLSAGISFAVFLGLFALAKLFPENLFARFLGGGGLVLAAVLIFVLNGVIVSLIDNRSSRHKDSGDMNTKS
jgi:hypothetical protein